MFRFYVNMQNNSSISFTSKIRFVDRTAFAMLKKNNLIDYTHQSSNILKADEFYSPGIRTCTGGGLVNPLVEAEGFHFWDDMVNAKKFPQLINSLFRFVKDPERGLLVGSKELKGSVYSIPQFQNFKKAFLERVKNVSLFEQHVFENSGTDYHYSLKDDIWTLCTTYIKNDDSRLNSVRTIGQLLKCFKNISIADGDRLFVGKKEVLPSEYPELFKSTQNYNAKV